jgi:L-lysine exporter family protein LysE/ArgO
MHILEILVIGILLGLGAAIPIGPINLEIIRRNLHGGTWAGLLFGLGACSADLIYLILLSLGALSLFTHPLILKIVAFVGAFVLVYFAYCAFTAKSPPKTQLTIGETMLIKQFLSGLLLTFSNPMTILFWASISTQVVTLSAKHPQAVIFAGLGVVIGTFSWVLGLNTFIHMTKHKISDRVIGVLNKIGGLILLSFAGYSIYVALFKLT